MHERTLVLGADVVAVVVLRLGGPELAGVAGDGALVADVSARADADRAVVAEVLHEIADQLADQAAMLADTAEALEAHR